MMAWVSNLHDEPNPPSPEPGDGVDVSLIRWLLSLSVAERLAVLQAQAKALARLRDVAGER